jgi:hypothetical protein
MDTPLRNNLEIKEDAYSHQQIEQIWNNAVLKYNEKIGKDRTAQIPKLTTPEELCTFIELHHQKFTAFVDRGAKLRTCLMYSLSPVKLLGDIAGGGASMVSW